MNCTALANYYVAGFSCLASEEFNAQAFAF
jgi:hypothetical protein